MPHYLRFYLTFLMPLTVFYAAFAGGWTVWIAPVWSFVLLPVMDYFTGPNTNNPPPEKEEYYSKHWGYNLVVLLWPLIQFPVLIAAVYIAATKPLLTHEFFGLALSVGIVTGSIGITWAHELCHRTSLFERGLAEALLTSVSYAHFNIEHVYGHHRNVSTPSDPATARYRESFYRFLPRTLIGSFTSAWRIEQKQLSKKKKPVLHYSNRMLRYILLQVVLYGAIFWFLGTKATWFFFLQAAIAITLLEIVNYMEHYGLLRREISAGKYEKVQPWHSWNSASEVSNLSLINLARHSDHHFKAARRFQILRHFEDAPQLPLGYGGMLLVALCPPLWFYIMNPRVEKWREQYACNEEPELSTAS